MDAVGGHLALAQLVQDLVGGPGDVARSSPSLVRSSMETGGPEWRFTVAANRTGGRPLL